MKKKKSKLRGTYIYIVWSKTYKWYCQPAFTRSEALLFAGPCRPGRGPRSRIVKRVYIAPPKGG